MKKYVYDYILSNPHVSIHEIASALAIQELETLKLVRILEKDGYVRMDSPIPLSQANNNSCFYSATGKEYGN